MSPEPLLHPALLKAHEREAFEFGEKLCAKEPELGQGGINSAIRARAELTKRPQSRYLVWYRVAKGELPWRLATQTRIAYNVLAKLDPQFAHDLDSGKTYWVADSALKRLREKNVFAMSQAECRQHIQPGGFRAAGRQKKKAKAVSMSKKSDEHDADIRGGGLEGLDEIGESFKVDKSLQKLLPPLTGEEFEALSASIKAIGVQAPIDVTEDWTILDGHHRAAIAGDNIPFRVVKGITTLAEKQAYAIHANTVRRNLRPDQHPGLDKTRRKVANALRAENPRKNTQQRVATMLGVHRSTVAKWWDMGHSVKRHTMSPDRARPDSRAKVPAKQRATIVKRIKAGDSRKQVAADAEISERQVSRIVARNDPDQWPKLGGDVYCALTHPDFPLLQQRLNQVAELIGTLASESAGRGLVKKTIKADLDKVRRAVDMAVPYADCPYCEQQGCKKCGHAGWLTRGEYDTIPKTLLKKCMFVGGKRSKAWSPKKAIG